MNVPFLDIQAQNRPLREELREAIDRVIDKAAFAGGVFVEEFEQDFAAYCGAQHAIGVGNGTDALWLALLALGVGPGDEVITVASTFMATAEAISYTGAKPVFIDIDEQSFTMDPSRLEAAITIRTKAVIPVHLFGQPASMDPILEIARRHGLFVIEDAAQAHGAEYNGRRAGGLADAGCFSFYPGKNLGAFGEAGAVVTNDEKLRDKIRTLRDHGQIRKYHHTMVGWNCRMDGIQGAVLRIKLRGLNAGNQQRQVVAAQYDREFQELEAITAPVVSTGVKHVYHVYAIRVQNRDSVARSLAEQGIGTGIHYPIPVHLQEAYRSLGYREGTLPCSERCAKEFLSLPMFPELSPEQVDYVAQTVKATVN